MTAPAPDQPAPTQPLPPTPTQPPRFAAPPRVVLVALSVGVAAALLVPGGPPGVGVVVVGAVTAAGLVLLSAGAPRRSRWQRVHAVSALLLVGAAAVRDAPWLVGLDLLAAALLASLALTSGTTWRAVLTAAPRLGTSTPRAAAELARGLRAGTAVGGPVWPAARGLVLTAVLLVVFVPLLRSADEGFDALLARVPGLAELDLPARLAVAALAAVAMTAAVRAVHAAPLERAVAPARRRLRRTSEWLLPLGALDALLAAFLVVQGGPGAVGTGGATLADQLHAGFYQLLAVTALVLGVVAASVRWTPMTPGVRAALGVLCLLTLAVAASAVSRLLAYTGAYGLTRLRIGVGVVTLSLAAVLVVVLVAGCRRGPQRWVPHTVVLVATVAALGLTAADPDAAIARSALARGDGADVAYLSTLSADAVPVLVHLRHRERDVVLAEVCARVPQAGWTSANLSRSRAARLLADEGTLGCRFDRP